MTALILPQNLLHLLEFIRQNAAQKRDKIGPYVVSALEAGRPLNTTVIVLAGYTGSGKSTLINTLFQDKDLCPTNDCSSQTSVPTTVKKSLCVTNVDPNIKGFLSFLDVPGSLDTSIANEAKNFAAVKSLFDTMEELEPRIDLKLQCPIRETVFPNVVLFVIRATDNRYIGDNTALRKALEQLKNQGNIIDRERPNLIVVITSALYFGIDPEDYTNGLNSFKTRIRYVVQDVLGILDFDIVAVENYPTRYRLPAFKDYFELPDNDISHYNLIEAMQKKFQANKDLIGELFLGWYMNPDCPERTETAIKTQHSEDICEAKINSASSLLRDICHSAPRPIPIFNFQLLGYGFCPVTENVKRSGALQPSATLQKTKYVSIGPCHFQVPITVKVAQINSEALCHKTFFDKESYERHASLSYKLDGTTGLSVYGNRTGRWIMPLEKFAMISFVFEHRLATVELQSIKDALQGSPLMSVVNGLPKHYSAESGIVFRNFFREWGTHLISKEAVGGAIYVKCMISCTGLDAEAFTAKQESVKVIFEQLLNVQETSVKNVLLQRLKELEVESHHVWFCGGNQIAATTLADLGFSVQNEWVQSIPFMPIELRQSIELFAFYNLVSDDTQYNALWGATKDYLQGKLLYNEPLYKQPRQILSRSEFSIQSSIITSKLVTDVMCSITWSVLQGIAHSPLADDLLQRAVRTGNEVLRQGTATATNIVAEWLARLGW